MGPYQPDMLEYPALVNGGFDNWNRVNQGKTCAFLAHIGSVASSPHTMCERKAENLMRPSQHIDNVMHAQSREEKEKNCLHLRTSIVIVRWLALQGCAFRGNDESLSSSNRGNFLELVKAFAKMSTKIDKVVLENTPKNAQYIAPEIQKEILHIMANRVKKIRGQRYDGASNMHSEWNGLQALFLEDCPYAYYVHCFAHRLQALFLEDCPYAYYVHCFAHRLQLTLVSAAEDVSIIWEFFSHLDSVVNIGTSSTKRIAELHTAQRNEIEHLLATGERDSGSGANQIGNLQRAGATRWSSHYDSIKSLIGMYTATCKVFEVLSEHSPNGRAKAEVRGIYRNMASFEFVFILHLMHKIMRTTDALCQILQRKTQDILAAISFVSTTKTILQEFREFSDDICKLATKFYPEDFTDQDIIALEYELIHFKLDVMQNLKVSTLVELCQQLTESERSKVYVMLTRLIHLVLTLHVSAATTERAFSAMKHVKTSLRNKMEDDFLADCLTLYIERDLAKDIDVDSIIDEFYVSKARMAQLC
ncbi:uncharacterized protein [Henckelia pumila]|uniref:uncharacterized protein n=1 Tax=Henckelia pumila TaxID=405737 RepID=UPI003C6DE259